MQGTFEHWITSVKYYLTQIGLINSDEPTLCQFLIMHLKSGSAPEMMTSASRKTRKAEMKPPNSFLSEIHALRIVFEEPDDPQRAMIKAGQIAWNGDYETLPMLYAEVLKSYATTAPGVLLGLLHARKMI